MSEQQVATDRLRDSDEAEKFDKLAYNRQWKKDNPERVKLHEKRRVHDPVRRRYYSLRHSAKRRGYAFDLTLDDIQVPTHCPVLGIPLLFSKQNTDNTPTIDRIDNSRGYTRDNICVVSFKANRMKSNATLEELKKLYDFYCTKT